MTNCNRILVWVVVFAISNAFAQTPTPAKEAGPCTDEDYAIYSVALSDVFGKQKADRVVLLDQTSMGVPPGMAAMTQFGDKAQGLLKDVPKEAKEDFDSRNKAAAKIEGGRLKVAFEVVLLSAQSAGKLVEGRNGWEGFRKEYPKAAGITLIARPGFNPDHSKALLYVGTSCDMLCGDGVFIFLGKDGDQWKVLNKATIWVS